MRCSNAMWKSFPNLQRAVVSRPVYSSAAQMEGKQMPKQKVLFICVHNSARSQMAEAFLNLICPDYFETRSAGLEPGVLNPLAVEAMREVGVDISGKNTQSVFDVFKSGQFFPYVITVCDETSAERCPIFQVLPIGCIGAFPIRPRFVAPRRSASKARAKSVIKSEPGSRCGVMRFVPWRPERIQ